MWQKIPLTVTHLAADSRLNPVTIGLIPQIPKTRRGESYSQRKAKQEIMGVGRPHMPKGQVTTRGAMPSTL